MTRSGMGISQAASLKLAKISCDRVVTLAPLSPAGFERYFAELAPLSPPANQGPLDEEAVGAVREKYGLEMDMGSVPLLAERHGLLIDEPLSSER